MKKHPLLFKKLQLLNGLGANAAIHSNSDLAKHVGISRQAISRWCRGTATSEGDKIPDYLIYRVAALYGVEPYWFTIPLDEFEEKVRTQMAAQTDGPVNKTQQISISSMPVTGIAAYGRDTEIDTLNHSWHDPRVNLLQIVGFGGVGKSTVLNRWLSDLSIENFKEANRVYAWSFYWQGHSGDLNSSGDFFIEHALEWFGDREASKGSPWAKANRLATLIRSYKTLLILDGLEPLQYPPGPRIGQLENPAVGSLIRDLAADNNGLCIITSRMEVADLESFEDGRVETLDLENLGEASSVELLENLGLKGGKTDFQEAARTYEGHPLSLSLLGGYLSVVHEGDIHRFRELESLIDEKQKGGRVRSLMQVYLDWFRDRYEAQILTLVGLFDRAVELGDLMLLAEKRSVPDLTDQLQDLSKGDWLYGINLLESVNLLTCQYRSKQSLVDCHPLVRDFINDYLRNRSPTSWRTGHGMIFEQLRASSSPNPTSMKHLEPLFRAVIHGAQADRYEEAFDIYFREIKNEFSMLEFGSHHTDQACIRAFFERQWSRVVPAISDESKAFLMASAATNLLSLGRINEAIEPAFKSINFYQENELWIQATYTAGPLISAQIAIGELHAARALIEASKGAVELSQHPVITSIAESLYGYINFLAGDYSQAEKFFESSDKVLTEPKANYNINFPTVSSYYCKFLLHQGRVEEALERSLKTSAWRQRKSWQVMVEPVSVYASDLLIQGLIFLELGDLDNAWERLNKQVGIFRHTDEWLYLPTGLLGRARFFIETDEFELAGRDIKEALIISTRTEAKLSIWESYLEYALLCSKTGDKQEGLQWLLKADSIEGMELYKFRDEDIRRLTLELQL